MNISVGDVFTLHCGISVEVTEIDQSEKQYYPITARFLTGERSAASGARLYDFWMKDGRFVSDKETHPLDMVLKS